MGEFNSSRDCALPWVLPPGFEGSGVGLAVVHASGLIIHSFGAAAHVSFLKAGERFPLPLDCGDLVVSGYHLIMGTVTELGYAPILVVPNHVEAHHAKEAAVLRRLGRVLTMHQRSNAMCEAAAHELRAEFDLAAVMIWILDSNREHLNLAASVGVQKPENGLPTVLRATGGSTCLAEIAVDTRNAIELESANDHILSATTEARVCYVSAGAISVFPLILSGEVLGVVEFVGREHDEQFVSARNLFPVIVEHLTLAANSAIMFERVERLASHDPLTGLANHRCMQEFLTARLDEAKRIEAPIAAAMIDVDHFRRFNEEEGHDAGDAVLRLVADALQRCSRNYDLVARYGGEEFTVLMPGADAETILHVADRMRAAVEQIPYYNAEGDPRQVTISIGCAVFPNNASDSTTLLKAADMALYRAKRNGRNRVEFATPSLDVVTEEAPAVARAQAFAVEIARQLKLPTADRKYLAEMLRSGKSVDSPVPQILTRIAEYATMLAADPEPASDSVKKQIHAIVASLRSAA